MHKILFIVGLLQVGIAIASPSTPSAKISPNLLSTLDGNPVANIQIIVDFVGSNRQVLNTIQQQSFSSRKDKLNTLKSSLQIHAENSQQRVKNFLNGKSITFQSHWISNQISIEHADRILVEALSSFPEVEQVYEAIVIHLEEPINDSVAERRLVPNDVEWGIKRIRADEAWEITTGSRVVVGSIDTGVRYTHEILRDAYRTPYGWLDATSSREPLPIDINGHGTHTMGTIVGSKRIGVAPGAQWIACRGCGDFGCNQIDLIECGEWMFCPTHPNGTDADCSKAPSIVTNAWSGGGNSHWFEAITEAWIAGGIVPIFSIGQDGPDCGSAGSPGDHRRVIGVGSIDEQSVISYFSSLGPAWDGRIKPELSAPGENIMSAIPDDDVSYRVRSGTSMGCAHVTGVTALLLSINPDMSFAQVRQSLLDGVDRNTTSCTCSCSNLADDVFPNFHYGFGVVDALNVVEAAVRTMRK